MVAQTGCHKQSQRRQQNARDILRTWPMWPFVCTSSALPALRSGPEVEVGAHSAHNLLTCSHTVQEDDLVQGVCGPLVQPPPMGHGQKDVLEQIPAATQQPSQLGHRDTLFTGRRGPVGSHGAQRPSSALGLSSQQGPALSASRE